jgi:hypothetical protein
VLRDYALRVDDLVVDVIAKVLCEDLMDRLERAPLVVALQILYVLQHERCRAMVVEDRGDVEEEVALPFILEAMFATKAVLL